MASSFIQLRNLPISTFKLDMSITQGIASDANNRALAEMAIEIARHFNLRVVACGVETRDQMALCQQVACDGIQGFLVNPPMPGNDIIRLFPIPMR